MGRRGKKRRLYPILKYQTNNVGGMMKLEKATFYSHHGNNSGKKNQQI
jgi:hypothetical protein